MGYAVRLAGTPVGQYLVAVEQRGSGRGRRLVVTEDPARARRWADRAAARRFWADSGLPADIPFQIDLLPEAGAEVCDFCSAPGPVWVYPAQQFAVTAHAWGSSGGWAACAPVRRPHRARRLDRPGRACRRRQPAAARGRGGCQHRPRAGDRGRPPTSRVVPPGPYQRHAPTAASRVRRVPTARLPTCGHQPPSACARGRGHDDHAHDTRSGERNVSPERSRHTAYPRDPG